MNALNAIDTILLPLDQIRIDGGTQSRVELNAATVAEYAEAMTEGATLPPVVVFHDGAECWLADGFHRHAANKLIGAVTMAAEVRQGGKREAILFACGANGVHGLRRTNEDKRKAVLTLLTDLEWRPWSNNEIARRCGVSQHFVGEMRASILDPIQDGATAEPAQKRLVQRAGRTFEQATGKIGRSRAKARASGGKPAAPSGKGWKPAAVAEPAGPPELTEEEQLAQDAHGGTTLLEDYEAASNEILELRGLLEVAQAADQTAEALKWRRAYDNAVQGKNDAMASAKQATDREAETMRWLRRVGKAVGEDNPVKIPAAVEMFVKQVKLEPAA